MKKRLIVLGFLVSFIFSSFLGCGKIAFRRKKIPAGYRGVKIYLYGTTKGVQSKILGVGKYWLTINEEIYLFPTFTQNYIWTKSKQEGSPNDESFTFQTIEGLSVGTDVGISYSVRPDSVDTIFQKYRKGIKEITDIYLRNMVRDAFVKSASTKTVESIYGAGKTLLLENVETAIRNQVDPIGIDLERIYFIGDLRLPHTVVIAINNKIQATQKAQQRENEIAEAEAEAKKKIAAAKGNRDSHIAIAEGTAKATLLEAEAQAKSNKLLANSITPLYVEYIRAKQWNGITPKITAGTDVWSMIQMSLDEEKE